MLKLLLLSLLLVASTAYAQTDDRGHPEQFPQRAMSGVNYETIGKVIYGTHRAGVQLDMVKPTPP